MYIIIARDQCNFCDTAKALLRSRKRLYKTYNIQDVENRWILTLMKGSALTTVPQIFDPKGNLIGGFKELELLLTEQD